MSQSTQRQDEAAMGGLGQKLWSVHWPIMVLISLITLVGVFMLYSVSSGELTPWASQHIVRFIVGLIVVFCLVLLRPKWLYFVSMPFFLGTLILLFLVLIMGISVNGSQRWLSFGGLRFQPSEFVKITLVMAMAAYYHWLPADKVSKPLNLLVPLLLIALPMALVLKQPDLGTSLIFALIGGGMMFMAGVSLLYFFGVGLSAMISFPYIWTYLKPYQKERVMIFLNPEQDPLGAGYHIMQSKIALGAGGLSGKGFMAGTQSQLDFLPEKHTDFIFTMFGEEMGFVGGITLIILYGLLLFMLLHMAAKIKYRFGRMLVSGFILTLFCYVFINIAMVMGLMPVVGVPLPFISYGGTAMLSLMVALGLAMNAYVHRALDDV